MVNDRIRNRELSSPRSRNIEARCFLIAFAAMLLVLSWLTFPTGSTFAVQPPPLPGEFDRTAIPEDDTATPVIDTDPESKTIKRQNGKSIFNPLSDFEDDEPSTTLSNNRIFGNFAPSTASEGYFRQSGSKTQWKAELAASVVRRGGSSRITLSSRTDQPYHIYESRPFDTKTLYSTVIVFNPVNGIVFFPPKPDSAPTHHDLGAGIEVDFHDPEVEWEIPFTVNEDAAAGDYQIEGFVGYQTCDVHSCLDPAGIRVIGTLHIDGDEKGVAEAVPLQISTARFTDASRSPMRLSWFKSDDKSRAEYALSQPGTKSSVAATPVSSAIAAEALHGRELLEFLGLALIGGVILNFMPCVLPVIGLKVISFVQEAKAGKKTVAVLNLWYVAGILCVFITLALATIVVREIFHSNLAWGDQFANFGFRLAITLLIFAMALSFLGVWEIPIPGFAVSDRSTKLMQQQGAIGAFCKGLLTTMLAVPCSGPALGAVFSLTLSQPPWIILLMYFAIGLGMSLPYILIAFNPAIVGWLPKPGPWMQTLKELLAFPLLLTVVWFVRQNSDDYKIAVITCLIVVWFACWWIGKVPLWAEKKTRVINWLGAFATILLGCGLALRMLGPHELLLNWEPYNEARLSSYREEGRAVMIDFTAKWCVNCEVNLLTAIETRKVAALISEKSVIPMIADKTDNPKHIELKLAELKSASIPVLAIYPAGKNREPIILRDLITESIVLDALRRATEQPVATKPVTKSWQ